PALFGGCRGDTTAGNTGTQNSSGPVADRQLSSCNPLLVQKEYFQAQRTLTKEADQLYYLYCRSREWISMAIIASAIFGRSAFTFGRIRIIRFISSEERCPLNMIYKHALAPRENFQLDKKLLKLKSRVSSRSALSRFLQWSTGPRIDHKSW